MKLNDVKTLLNTLITTQTKVTPMLWGRHGLGKSQIVAQVAKDAGYSIFNIILSQKEAVDVAGVLFTYENKELGMSVTASHPPDWFATALSKGRVVLFLDEFNMGRREVMNAAFELVLDRRLNNMKLPDSVFIVCAGNPDDARYDVTPMSESLHDRLMHIKVEADVSSWLMWSNNEGKDAIHSDVSTFISQFPDAAYLKDKLDDGFPVEIKHSFRSWERVSAIHKLALPAAIKTECIRGIVGLELAVAFMQRFGSNELPLDAFEIINLDATIKARIVHMLNPKRMRIDLLNQSITNLVISLKGIPNSSKYVNNVVQFIKLLPDDVAQLAISQLFEFPGYSDAFLNDADLKEKIKTISDATTLKVA